MICTPHILAIDVGKFNSVLCRCHVATREHTFRTIRTTPDEIRDAIQCQHGVTVVVEARLAAIGERQPVQLLLNAVRQRMSLISLRRRLLGEQVRGQNRMRG
jgi:hypothetical protein